jgi:hypothetical protein
LYDWIKVYGVALSSVTMVIAFIIFLAVLATFCICCHPENKKRSGGYYQRMGYYDEGSS